MPIVSISLTDEILKEIDNLQKSMGFSNYKRKWDNNLTFALPKCNQSHKLLWSNGLQLRLGCCQLPVRMIK